MAYTTIDDPTLYFNTVLYTGDGNNSRAVTGVGHQPDLVWFKDRELKSGSSNVYHHQWHDSVRGATQGALYSSLNNAEDTSYGISSFNSDGFTLRNPSHDSQNESGEAFVAWNWKAGGTAPSQTYTVKVVSDSGNKYRFDDFGTSAVTLDLQEGGTYTFDQSDSSNSGHPLRFSTTSDGTHGSGTEYTTGVTTTGTPGSAGAKTVITVASGAATLYYYCSSHSGMGGQANTNSTHGSSNFSGSIQANVTSNTDAGFSIVSYTGTGANATVGHGLGVAPKVIFVKSRSGTYDWLVYHDSIGNGKAVKLNTTSAQLTSSVYWNSTSPTSSVFSLGTSTAGNSSSATQIAYCFAEKKGYSKFGSYTGNGSADGTFVYTGFKPAVVIVKCTSNAEYWYIADNKRPEYNGSLGSTGVAGYLRPNDSSAEASNGWINLLSNGFKMGYPGSETNGSGRTHIYMAFAESPFVSSTGIPTTAR